MNTEFEITDKQIIKGLKEILQNKLIKGLNIAEGSIYSSILDKIYS